MSGLSLSQEKIHQEIGYQGHQPTEEHLARDVTHIPQEGNILDFHECIARRIADLQQSAPHTSALRNQMPILAVLRKTAGIFSHALHFRNQRIYTDS